MFTLSAFFFEQREGKFHDFSFLGAKVQCYFCSREQRLQGMKVPPMELSFLGTKVLRYRSSSYHSNEPRLKI